MCFCACCFVRLLFFIRNKFLFLQFFVLFFSLILLIKIVYRIIELQVKLREKKILFKIVFSCEKKKIIATSIYICLFYLIHAHLTLNAKDKFKLAQKKIKFLNTLSTAFNHANELSMRSCIFEKNKLSTKELNAYIKFNQISLLHHYYPI